MSSHQTENAHPVCPIHGTPSVLTLQSGAYLCTDPAWARHAWEPLEPHEFTEDVADGSMCICGVPALTHDDLVFPPASETA